MSTKGYIKMGYEKNNLFFEFPYPTSAPFITSAFVDGARSSVGEVVGDQIGREISKHNLSWGLINKYDWWALNRFFHERGIFFYIQYFNHSYGWIETAGYYCGDRQCEISGKVKRITGEPEGDYYRNVTVNLIDRGEIDGVDIQTLPEIESKMQFQFAQTKAAFQIVSANTPKIKERRLN